VRDAPGPDGLPRVRPAGRAAGLRRQRNNREPG
jgi:hypothetical protein